MGIFNVALEIGDPEGQRYETIEAMVDSGAAYTIVPSSLLTMTWESMRHSSRTFILADGTRIRRGFGQTWMRLERQKSTYRLWSSGTKTRPPCWER